ncbi:unnamed protein product [Peronospora belbahrii]|uniref:NTF2 domain-containing protein n=1 Tax=Peronospora belbahrii TaxID=622444 RepID=A0AAU9L2U0_9STRA|nr:unnamed protein product [Peronospora belbahrii]CAH0517139.1 unnamed protein product [Peronospora belbahrii]
MPETSSPPTTQSDETIPSPSIVGNTFMRQYYHFLAKEPQSLHRFYKAESRWCHGFGSHMEEPIAGQRAINDQILKRGYAGARVDLDAGSIDCQNSLGDGVLVLVTGVMTLRSSPEPKPFVQTFFLAVQPKGYFVLNDCLRFLELSEVSNEDMDKEKKSFVSEKNAKDERQTPSLSPIKKMHMEEQEEVDGSVSSEKAASPVKTKTTTTTSTINMKVRKEDTPLSPMKTTTAVASSPMKKTMATTMTTTEEEEAPAVIAKTPSPAKKLDETPSAAASASFVAPADPVVAPPAEPVKPKTWAALFSVSKPATIVTPDAATASPATTPSTAATLASSPAPAVISPTSGAPAPEKSPKNNKLSNGNEKEKEHKRFYSLFIRDLPPQTRENDLHELFKGYGSIASVNLVLQRNFAFVDYYEQESMRAALAETKEFKVLNKVLQVTERGDRKEGQRSGFRNNDPRGRGRGYGPKSGRGDRGDRKERNGNDAPPSNKGERRDGFRREKTSNRRGGKVDGTSRAE